MKTVVRLAMVLGMVVVGSGAWAEAPIVIAHRGASGYLPEHTLAAYAMAHAMGADYIEQDLVMTKDRRLVALHDIHLEGTTNVEDVYPNRAREDGRWYAADFTLAEIKQLAVHERTKKRFPVGKAHFGVPTFEEAIELIQGLNATTGREAGIYPELKNPTFHREAGLDIEPAALDVLTRYGYAGRDAKVYIQCFEKESLMKLRDTLGTDLPLVLLISNHKAQATERTEAGLKAAARYVDGVGPNKGIIEKNPDFVDWAHGAGLVVHPYTIRDDELPAKYTSAAGELRQFFAGFGVDGIFTDFPDTARAVVDTLKK
jgi:glycerophosphoryl diester phosphodiesterase